MAKTETQVVLEICDFLKSEGYFFWRSNNIPAGGRTFGTYRALPKYTPKGLPDIMLILGGAFYGIEVKKPEGDPEQREPNGRRVRGGVLTPEQREWATALMLAGGTYVEARSIEDVRKALDGVLIRTAFVHRMS